MAGLTDKGVKYAHTIELFTGEQITGILDSPIELTGKHKVAVMDALYNLLYVTAIAVKSPAKENTNPYASS